MNRCLYRLESILFIAICTILSGGDDYHDMESFGKEKLDWLEKYLNLPFGTPSHDTYNRVFENIDKEEFRTCLQGISLVEKLDLTSEIFAIDGKKLRGSSPGTRGNEGLYILTAWACEEEVSLGEVRVEDKSNEITAIPKLLEKLDLPGSTISIDAIGCQKDIAEQIIEGEGDYILAVKKNQKLLMEEIEDSFSYGKIENEHVSWDCGHGRYEERKCTVLDAREFLTPRELRKWKGVASLVRIGSLRIENDIRTTGTRYYISSHSKGTEYFNDSIRKHWSIENKLHWNLDAILKEDSSRTRTGNAPENLNTLRKFCLKLLIQKKDGISKPKKRFKAALNSKYLEEILNVKI